MAGSGAGDGGRGCQTWVLAREGYCVQNGFCEDQFQEKYVWSGLVRAWSQDDQGKSVNPPPSKGTSRRNL